MFGEAVTGVLYLRNAQVSWNEKNISCVAYHDNGPTIRKSMPLKMNCKEPEDIHVTFSNIAIADLDLQLASINGKLLLNVNMKKNLSAKFG